MVTIIDMENNTEKIMTRTNILPVVPLRGKVAFPGGLVSFEAGREMTLKAIERASLTDDKQLFICTQKQTEKDEISATDLYTVGCVAKIKQTVQVANIPYFYFLYNNLIKIHLLFHNLH